MRAAPAILLIIFSVGINCTTRAQDLDGNWVIAGCNKDTKGLEIRLGYCIGVLKTLVLVGRELPKEFRICVPPEVTNEQLTKVAIKFASEHPQHLHQDFRNIALAALQSAWPCR